MQFTLGLTEMGRKDKAISSENITAFSIGARMRSARQERGISLTEMAKRLGYSKGYLSGIENGGGGRYPSGALVESYERELGLKPKELIGGKVEELREGKELRDVTDELSNLLSTITDPDFFGKLIEGNKHQRFQPFDMMTDETITVADLDYSKVTDFLQRDRVQMQQDFSSTSSNEDQLRTFGLLRGSHPTYGALLCFGQNPTRWLAGSSIRCIQWVGNNRNSGWLVAQDYQRDLITQFESGCNFLRRHLRLFRVFCRDGHSEELEIPFIALHEALANALIHREYANETSPVYIDIFENRVEISSPGYLPEPMTLELLQEEHKSHPRNPQIARIFYLLGFVEKVGSGIQRMQHMLENANLQRAKFKYQKDNIFTVTFSRPEQHDIIN